MPALKLRSACLLGPILLASASALGCGDTCHDGSGELVPYSEGQTNAERTYYQSGPIQGPYLHFPSGRIFELEHDLLEAPTDVVSWLSFDEDALLGNNNVAEAAGNQVVIECVSGPEPGEDGSERKGIIRVRNDTCSDFYLRVVGEVGGTGLGAPDARPCRP